MAKNKGTKVVGAVSENGVTMAPTNPDGNGHEGPRSEKEVKKRTCPINRKHFQVDAKPIKVRIGDREFMIYPKEFSTGSMGWNLNEKLTVMVGETPVDCQVGLNLTVIGSKDLPPSA